MTTTTTPPAAPGGQTGHQAKIMVVDDDVRLRDLLRRYLTEQGTLIASFNWHPAERMIYTMHIHRSKDKE